MTTRFQGLREAILKPEYTGKDLLPISETFSREAFEALTGVVGCTRIRSYLGMDDNLQVRLIFVAVNSKDEDILPDDGGVIIEVGSQCPPKCGISVLNPPATL